MEGYIAAMETADFPYVSCNFYSEADGIQGENVLGSYEVFELGGVSVAIIGITTPESFTKSPPAYFQDDDGNYIYGMAGGPDGEELYDAAQEAIPSPFFPCWADGQSIVREAALLWTTSFHPRSAGGMRDQKLVP